MTPSFLPPDAELEARIRDIGAHLFDRMEAAPAPGLLSRQGMHARLMDWVMEDPGFKTQVFRFVDVLPTLESAADVVRHLQEYLGDRAVRLNPALDVGLRAASLAPAVVVGPVRRQVAEMAAQFVAAETMDALIGHMRENVARGVSTTLDLLGESVVSDAEADQFLQRNLDALDAVARYAAGTPRPVFASDGPSAGAWTIPRFSLSVKISALAPRPDPTAPERTVPRLQARLRPLLRRAAELDTHVTFDMEHHGLKALTLALFRSVLADEEFHERPALGIALQAYLRETEADLRQLVAFVRDRQRPIGVRLVKGAYWDYETIVARQRGWPVPVWSRKADTDANFEKLTTVLLEARDVVRPHFATHNVRSCAHAIAQAERLGLAPHDFEFQALFGMADALKAALVDLGYAMREYCPVGELLPGMAYFVRRLLENTSNEGFLRLAHTGAVSRDALLRNPVETTSPVTLTGGAVESAAAREGFANSPLIDFTRAEARALQEEALETFRTQALGREYPLVIDGRRIADRAWVPSVNPAHPEQVVGRWARATAADAEAAVTASVAFAPRWRATPVTERAAMLERTADLMEARRATLNALLILEAGKPWTEADGDVSEAVDFCRYYARQMRELTPRATQDVPGEDCSIAWWPRGVGAAIAPWNFPLAILTGLTVAPLVAGNCMLVKPAHQTAVLGAHLVDLLLEAGVPAGAIHFVPGSGAEVGAYLAAHPKVDFLSFTGSRAVGCSIWEEAGRTHEHQVNLKKVVCEMGGKNAVIVDTDADLDEAILAALQSAFGYSGQKCSALSRLILLDEIHDRFVERFVAACASVPVGDPAQPGTMVGPVIDGSARNGILGYIAQGRREATLAYQAALPEELVRSGGFYVPPTVFAGARPEHTIVREEIFGPVVSVLRARDLDEAFRLANQSDYALTGGLFSRSPSAIARARAELEVGNLYINRGITGAIVERHPFGGFKMSGGGTKAGGADYLKNFLFPRVVAENVLRRGFVPDRTAR